MKYLICYSVSAVFCALAAYGFFRMGHSYNDSSCFYIIVLSVLIAFNFMKEAFK